LPLAVQWLVWPWHFRTLWLMNDCHPRLVNVYLTQDLSTRRRDAPADRGVAAAGRGRSLPPERRTLA